MSETHRAPAILSLRQRLWVGGDNVGAAVYGSIIGIAVTGAWHADPTATAQEALLSSMATALVFWVAHAYADWVSMGIVARDTTLRKTHQALVHDWPIVHSSLVPCAVLFWPGMGLIENHVAMRWAMGLGVSNLWIFGLWAAWSGGRSWLQAIPIATGIALLGLGIVVLEIRLG